MGKPRGSIQVKTGEFLEQQAFDGPRGRFDPSTLTTYQNQTFQNNTNTCPYILDLLDFCFGPTLAPKASLGVKMGGTDAENREESEYPVKK